MSALLDARAARLAAAATLVLLLAHAWHYRFLTDDAFISFRYAANFAAGDGLVFNAGERVEGYSNFLWVLILAAFRIVGGAPETVSQVLSLILTVVLWAEVAAFARRREPDAWSLLPLALLAVNRSVAVWSTSGLETRLFEVLIVGAVLRLAVELEDSPPPGRWLSSGLLFGLASLTRPDAPLIAVTVLAAGAFAARRRRQVWGRLLISGSIFAVITAAHFAFRRLYYGDWLPNTYYAKVGGETWWGMGARYLGAFVIEYAVWLWFPFLAAAVLWHRRRRTLQVPLLFAAAVLPHMLYVVAIGGDHFEYRPFDLYFPFAFLLIADGARELAWRSVGARWLAGGLAAVLAGLTLLPWQCHRQFPEGPYRHGFPGLWTDVEPAARRFLDPDRALIHRLPGLRSLAVLHRDLLRTLSAGYVGLRAEEHARFVATVVPKGRALRRLVETGELAPGTRIAIDAVGVIPYHAGLPVLDRLGLTDREVARSPSRRREFLAHDKRATFDDARDRGTDLWAVHQVHLLWSVTDLELHELLATLRGPVPAYLARTSRGLLLARLPQGAAAARRRLPGLDLHPVGASLRAELADEAIRRLATDDPEDRRRLARLLVLHGRRQEALTQYRQLLAADDRDPAVLRGLAGLEARAGNLAAAGGLLSRLIELDWEDADAYNNLGNIRLLEGRPEAAIDLYQQALVADPERVESRLNLANALSKAGRSQDAAAQVRAVLALDPGHPDANLRMAEARLAEGRRLAALGYFADALAADPRSAAAAEGFERLRRRLAGVEAPP